MEDIISKSTQISQQIACVKREIALRKAVYPNLVARGRKTAGTAEFEIACMSEVLNTLVLAERSHLNRSFNRPQNVWRKYPAEKPSEQDFNKDFLICYTNPAYIKKFANDNRAPHYFYTVLTWTGADFLNTDNLDIQGFMPLTDFPF